MNAAEIAHALGGRRSGKSFMCRCPGTKTARRPLSLTEGDHAPLLKCFAGCDSRDVIDALRAHGLWDAARPSPSRRQIAAQAPTGPTTKPPGNGASTSTRHIWKAARDPRGTLAEQYLNGRRPRLPTDFCGRVLRFHPACPWGKARQCLR